MKIKLAVALVLICSVTAIAQMAPAGGDASKEIATSTEYPLLARIVAVEMRTASSNTRGVSSDSSGNVSGGGGGGTYTWHLMKTVIGDKLYGLSVPFSGKLYGISLSHRNWLEIGSYPAKRIRNGFEVQYLDDKGKTRHETLLIQSEEPYPAEPAK
jgi:hypothetical protein